MVESFNILFIIENIFCYAFVFKRRFR